MRIAIVCLGGWTAWAAVFLPLFSMTSSCAAAAFVSKHTISSLASTNARTARRSLIIQYLTPDEMIAQARAKTGINVDEEEEEDVPAPPKLFEDDLLHDMQQALLKLERRVKEGRGALSAREVDDLNSALNRIAVEMRVNEDQKPPRPPPRTTATASTPTAAGGAASNVRAAVPQPADAPPSPATTAASWTTTTTKKEEEHNQEEGPAFDGRGGMGQPRGTVNTYVIPGMDEMSPEEYRDALQRSVSERQAIRRKTTVVGNRSSQNYMDGLRGGSGGGGDR